MRSLSFILVVPFLMLTQMCSSSQSNQTVNSEMQQDLIQENINFELEYLVREPADLSKKAPVLVLLHGYGSNEKDLFSFASQIPNDWLVVSARAPIQIGQDQHKWYNVAMVDEKITMNFEDEEKSRKLILNFVNQIVKKYKADDKKVVVAGFSQGANMSVGLALTAPEKIYAAGCFSGRFMEEIKPLINNQKALKNKKVFISHGTKDNMLPMSYAEENQTILEGYGLDISLSTDQVAHSISRKQMGDFIIWLNNL